MMQATRLTVAEPPPGSERTKALRLLVLSSDTYPPNRVDVSVLFGEELAERGHRIDWLLQSESACSRAHTRRWGGGVALVGRTDLGTSLYHRIRKHILGIAHDMKVLAVLRRRTYDVVEVKDKFVSGVFALLGARLFRVRFIYWLSYPFPEHYLHAARSGFARYPLLYRVRGMTFSVLLYRILLPLADHVFVQSEQMRRDIAAKGISPGKMTAVPMGIRIDSDTAAALQERSLIPSTERCMLYLGTLIRARRLDFLVRVLALVRRSVPEAKLYIVGRGEEPGDEQLLLDEALKHGISSAVVLVGELPRAQALRYVREADVCVSPFYPTPILNSTSPTKLVEYLAMGKAVVANDHPEQRMIIEHSGAGYCAPWDEEAFSAAIVKLLNAPEQRMAMGERGRRYVLEHRSYRKIADAVERDLLRVVARATDGAQASEH